MRRAVALGALVVIVLLIALGIHSCDVSSTNTALQNYTNSVSSLIAQSQQDSTSIFGELSGAGSGSGPTQVQEQINRTLSHANKVLSDAKDMSVPDQVKTANSKVVLALQMRADGIANIADQIQPALGTTASQAAINSIAAQIARFYASDVLYKDYAAPEIAAAVNAAGVRFSALNSDQFVPSVLWNVPAYIATQLHVTIPGANPNKITPGTHGHMIDSVSFNGTQLSTTSPNTVPAKPAPTFTLSFTNSGQNNEFDVVCKVVVNGTSVSGTSTVSETFAGKPATCNVKLNGDPPAGTQTMVATIEKVPGEHVISNNSLTFTMTFQ